MKPTTTVSRLLHLADFLETLPLRRFYYASWVGPGWGTTACALGWATTLPRFRRLGLRLEDSHAPVIGKHGGFDAAVEIFGLSRDEAIFLFKPNTCSPLSLPPGLPPSPGAQASPKDVAVHIRRFVKAKQTQGRRVKKTI